MTINNHTHSHTRRKPLRLIALGWAAGGFALTAALAGGIGLQAQSIAAHNSRAPVNYAADRIELQDRQNRVVLSGNVVINQAGLRVQSARTLVNYDDSGELRIDRITATGGVTLTRGDERASGDVAIYDFNRRIITMAGNVRLRRGTDTLNGGRLVIDLRSGLSSVDGRASGNSVPGSTESSDGRVTGSFSVPQGDESE
ncbi:LptA/OstA family protein [uncultured Erythrobacter sp.]|uniref:LptA/OstA family protein n=1 Tax=uncultured Erythrobacter sp. TaxID=263913 RepID=UPI00260E40C0|nr:LptA/OstA family protein [uncultured Erythrobacter sp.]